MKIPLLILTHAALGFAAWGVTREFRSQESPVQITDTQVSNGSTSQDSATKSQILSSIESQLIAEAAAKDEFTKLPNIREKILTAIGEAKLPTDPANSIRNLTRTKNHADSIKAAALFILWSKSEPSDAIGFAYSYDDFGDFIGRDEAIEIVGESIDPKYALSWNINHYHVRDPLFAGLARQLIASRTLDEIFQLINSMEEEHVKSGLIFHLSNQWPVEKLDDYGRFVTALKDLDLLYRMHDKLPPMEMVQWLNRFADMQPDKDFADKIRASDAYYFLHLSEPSIDLDARLDAIVRRPAKPSRGEAISFLAEQDVSGFFHNKGTDLAYAFHHGKIEASEILAMLSTRFPEYAETGILPELLHKQLTSEDPDRAAYLIADLQPVAQARIISESAWSISSLNTLERIIAHFPTSNDEDVLQYRQKFWENVTDHGLDNYDEDYPKWIMTALSSLDRKMALEAIANRIDNSLDFKADEIRDIVGDIPLRDSE